MNTRANNSSTQSAEAAADAGAHAQRAPAAEAAHPPLLTGGERYLGEDPYTGERAFLVPRNRIGEFALVPLPDERAHSCAAITDWLNFTFPFSAETDLGQFFPALFDAISSKLAPAVERPIGKHAYARSFRLGETKALFAFGGNRGTALISLPGEVCALVNDWRAVVDFGTSLGGRITRWDGAVDDYLGTHSVDHAIELYRAGLFGSGGRLPKLRQHGNWIDPDGSGRTVEIGSRLNGKRLIVYEKGMQLGAEFHPWTRWEMSYGNCAYGIQWDVLLDPGRHVAGAYPKALDWVRNEMSRVATLQRQTQISYEQGLRHMSRQWGKFLRLAREVEGSADAAFKRVEREGIPRRLQHPAVENPEAWIE